MDGWKEGSGHISFRFIRVIQFHPTYQIHNQNHTINPSIRNVCWSWLGLLFFIIYYYITSLCSYYYDHHFLCFLCRFILHFQPGTILLSILFCCHLLIVLLTCYITKCPLDTIAPFSPSPNCYPSWIKLR